MADLGPTTIFGNLNITGSIGGAVRIAYVKTTPGAVTAVDVYLDTDGTGEEVSVECSIIPNTGGTDLQDATPTLENGDLIFVIKIGGTWYCVSLFHPTS